VKRRGRMLQQKIKDYKTLAELAEKFGMTRQGLHVRLSARRIPYDKIGDGKRVSVIVVHRRYWKELGAKKPEA
jgi:Zn-dependent peptidase ImmA (M78 family)